MQVGGVIQVVDVGDCVDGGCRGLWEMVFPEAGSGPVKF